MWLVKGEVKQMAIGYYLLVGDKTTCGGQIITGDHTMTFNGRATAREGDKVTCGKHPGTYTIVGGISDMFDMGQRLAGTLDSVSTCPCRARFINSVMDSYEKQEQPRQQPAHMTAQNFSSPVKEATTVQHTSPPVTQAPPPPIPVFAKSRQRGKGCTDAGTETEPANNFGRMAIYQVQSSPRQSRNQSLNNLRKARNTLQNRISRRIKSYLGINGGLATAKIRPKPLRLL